MAVMQHYKYYRNFVVLGFFKTHFLSPSEEEMASSGTPDESPSLSSTGGGEASTSAVTPPIHSSASALNLPETLVEAAFKHELLFKCEDLATFLRESADYKDIPFEEAAAMKVCDVIELLEKTLASDPDTRNILIQAKLYLLLETHRQGNSELMRERTLRFFESLTMFNDPDIVNYLLFRAPIIPACINCMRVGSTVSKSVATFIVYKILLQDNQVMKRYDQNQLVSICKALGRMVERLFDEEDEIHSSDLLKNITRCLLRLSRSDEMLEHTPSKASLDKIYNNLGIALLQVEPESLRNLIALKAIINPGQPVKQHKKGKGKLVFEYNSFP